MTSLLKKISDRGRLPGFTLIELLVALSLISIGAVSSIGIFSQVARISARDAEMERAVWAAQSFLSGLMVATNAALVLFKPEEYAALKASRLPVLMPPKRLDAGPGVYNLVNVRVVRLDPLLCDIGVESVVEPKVKGGKIRRYWMETTLSGLYLGSLR